jgi:hypothetical protein
VSGPRPASTGPSATARRLEGAAGWCLLLAAVALAGWWFDFVWVLGTLVVPGWAVSVGLLGVSIALAIVRAIAGEQGAAKSTSPGWILSAVLIGLFNGFALLADFPATYTVLRPDGPGFCRVAVQESSFLFAGRGNVYAVGFAGLGREVGSWTADDGYRPIAAGSYELHWDDEGAVLSVYGDGGNPVWPNQHEVPCP